MPTEHSAATQTNITVCPFTAVAFPSVDRPTPTFGATA